MAYIIITSWFGVAHIYWWGPERSWRLCSRLSIGLLGGTWLGTIHGVRTHLCKVLRPIKGCGLTKHPYLGIQNPWVNVQFHDRDLTAVCRAVGSISSPNQALPGSQQPYLWSNLGPNWKPSAPGVCDPCSIREQAGNPVRPAPYGQSNSP